MQAWTPTSPAGWKRRPASLRPGACPGWRAGPWPSSWWPTPEPTAKEVAQALGVSKGALSPALGYLVRLHLVERFRRPGERADRYTMRPGAWRRILEEQARMLGRFRELAERGLALVGENPRLREVRDLYAFLEREFPLLLAKLEEG